MTTEKITDLTNALEDILARLERYQNERNKELLDAKDE